MKKIQFILIVLSFFFGCKRYEENPPVVFNSFRNRINGDWEIEKIIVNGTESLKQIIDTTDTIHINYYHINILSQKEINNSNEKLDGVFSIVLYPLNNYAPFPIELDKKKTTLTFLNKSQMFFISKGYVPGTIITSSILPYKKDYYLYEQWKIIRLTKSELWLTLENNDTTYETHLTKKEN